MKDAKKPERWQMHLSTALVLLLAIGTLLGVNLHRHPVLFLSQGTFAYGWPIPLVHEQRHGGFYLIEPKGWIIDICYWAFLLFLCWFTVEWRMHRGNQLHGFSYYSLLIVAAVLVLANVIPDSHVPNFVQEVHICYGFPNVTLERNEESMVVDEINAFSNLIDGLLLLWIIAFISEWLIRRREARKA